MYSEREREREREGVGEGGEREREKEGVGMSYLALLVFEKLIVLHIICLVKYKHWSVPLMNSLYQ